MRLTGVLERATPRSWAWLAATLAGVTAIAVSGCTANAPASETAATRTRTASPAAARTPEPVPLGKLGTYQVGQHRITFVEPAHVSTGGYRLPPRHLVTLIRYPLASGSPAPGSAAAPGTPAKGPLPLIVFGPGFMSCTTPYSALLRAWASAGYVVAALNFPHSSCKVGAAATETDLVNQPADMSSVITQMLALSASPHGLFSGLVNPAEVAIAGHSDGGDTVAAMAANTCCLDHRVRAAAVLSGAEWPAMHGTYFTAKSPSMLFVQGSADPVNWPACSVQMYQADRSQNRYYLDMLGVNHTRPYWDAGQYQSVVIRVTTAFFDRWVLAQQSAGAAMAREGNVSGIAAFYSGGTGPLKPGPCDNTPPAGSG